MIKVLRYGVLIVNNETHQLLKFLEKDEYAPPDGKSVPMPINAGVYILEPEIFSFIEPNKNVSIEDSMIRIDMLIENYGDFPQTCGGVISKRNFKYGYFETAVKVDGGDGWHEAFWTSYSNGRNYLSQDPITISRSEIDGLEHYCTHNINEFSYGIIEWWDGGNQSIYREKHSTPHDLNDTLYTWAFEFTPDYFNFFFDGKVIATINSNRIPKNDFFIWLSSIGIRMASKNGVCFFDYFRYYDIDFDSQEYKQRKELFTKNLSIR